ATTSSSSVVPGVSRRHSYLFLFRKTRLAIRAVTSGTGPMESGHNDIDFFCLSSHTNFSHLRRCCGQVLRIHQRSLLQALEKSHQERCASGRVAFSDGDNSETRTTRST